MDSRLRGNDASLQRLAKTLLLKGWPCPCAVLAAAALAGQCLIHFPLTFTWQILPATSAGASRATFCYEKGQGSRQENALTVNAPLDTGQSQSNSCTGDR
jgi:hypothetical protein